MLAMQLARYMIAFSWIYHGLFPKLIQIAPIEMAMSSSIGLSEEHTYILIKFAGIGEVLFGLLFLVLYRIKTVIVLNLAALLGLLGFVVIQMPHLLAEAFNPVTTNLPLVVLSVILLDGVREKSQVASRKDY